MMIRKSLLGILIAAGCSFWWAAQDLAVEQIYCRPRAVLLRDKQYN